MLASLPEHLSGVQALLALSAKQGPFSQYLKEMACRMLSVYAAR